MSGLVPTVEPEDENESAPVPSEPSRSKGANSSSGLPGFSSNAEWSNPDALWSHHPVQPGAKAGFHDPVEAAPQRAELWGNQNEPDAADDAVAFRP